jgi:hypothetical protein
VLLQNKQLWFSRVDLLGDPWELTLAGQQLAHVVTFAPPHSVEQPPPTETVERIIRAWHRMTFVTLGAVIVLRVGGRLSSSLRVMTARD